jgi:hypothetical protein
MTTPFRTSANIREQTDVHLPGAARHADPSPEAIRRLMERGLDAAERRKLRAPKPRKAGK